MNITQIQENLQKIVQSFNSDTFIYDVILAYGQPKSSVTRLQQTGGLNLSKIEGEIDWKKKLFYKAVSTEEDVHALFEKLKSYPKALKNDPRFIIVTDFETLLAFDTKTRDALEIPILDLAKHFDFLLPWAGMEKAQVQVENPADVKAAEKMAKLYAEITKDNPTQSPEDVHSLNIFLSRLLFCFFAEDTGIFTKDIFSHSIESHTQQDGSDLHTYLDALFTVMNTPPPERIGTNPYRADLPAYLAAFPYVNGGLFKNKHAAPRFTTKSRKIIIECGGEDWSAINPDIFGSMIQAVITPEHRGGLGMHYTSVPNIMKVIEPLFLNDLYEAFEKAQGNDAKLKTLENRLSKIKIFDPACGSGNFLIIAYKELRKLEIAILKESSRIKGAFGSGSLDFGNDFLSSIALDNFYGIEIDDFAHEIAILSLWLAEHQMNQVFFKEFGVAKPALPLMQTGNIAHGNATRLEWSHVCPHTEGSEIFVLGNPPYLGARVQNDEHKADLDFVFNKFKKYRDLDYIACWFYKAGLFIQKSKSKFSFVSTNSICQGEQVALLWNILLDLDICIYFATTSFKWVNNAKYNAGVTVIIIGMEANDVKTPKRIYTSNLFHKAENINPYLVNAKNVFAERRHTSISNLPDMSFGNMPNDGGGLILETSEKDKILENYPSAVKFFKKLLGSAEFIRGSERYCLWIENEDLGEALSIPPINSKIDMTRKHRMSSKDEGTQRLALRSHQFRDLNRTTSTSIIVPSVSSERRDYIPMGFLDENTIISNAANAIYDSESFIFSILNSRIHMTWVRAVGGRLKTDYRYSAQLIYNTFPMPPLSINQQKSLDYHVYRIIEEREAHCEKTLAQLYDPDKMPDGLREAHRDNDLAVERLYRSKPFESDEERLAYLFKLYEEMIAAEKTAGTLFDVAKKKKK